MKLYILSRRHAESKSYCDCCSGNSRRVARVMFVSDGQPREIRICAPCAREAMHAARETPGRKAVRR